MTGKALARCGFSGFCQVSSSQARALELGLSALGELEATVEVENYVPRAQKALEDGRPEASAKLRVVAPVTSRALREVCGRAGLVIFSLARTRVGGVRLGELPAGQWTLVPRVEEALLEYAKRAAANGFMVI